MKGWNVKRVDEIGKIITGKTPSSDYPDEFGLKYPFITPSDIPNTQKYISVERFLSEKGMESHKRIKLPPKTTCVVCIGATIGKVCTTTVYSFSNQQINNIIPNEENDPDFVYYLASTLKDALVSFAGGAATPIVNKSAFSSIKVLVPAKKCQRKIAAILSAYDDLIENNNRRIAILEKMAEELYREWFVRLRFPGHEKVKIVKGVPEGWEVVKLGDVCKVARGSSPRPITDIKYFQDGNIPWIKIADATSSKMFIFNTKECVNEFGASFSRKLPRESLIIATSGTLGFCILLGVEGCVHDGWMYLTQYQKNIKPSFIYYVINSYKEHLNNLSYGAAIQNINTEIIRRLSIMVPSLYIIDKFYLIVNPIQKNIYSLGKENILLQNIRDRLLSRLMSGKIDVENMDIQFPASMRCAEPVEAQEEAVDA